MEEDAPSQELLLFDDELLHDRDYIEGRDELNLAEFPLASISNSRKDNDKVIEFEDTIYDDARKEVIARKLTIAASAQHGLPTALDDEVILGLVQLSKLDNFRSRKVFFSRYQLIKILGWKDHSESYRRIEEALNRWAGLFLVYEKAWRDKSRSAWVDAKFHIIDNVEIFRPDDPSSPDRCSFTWNDVVYRNFAAGSLKKLDFHLYRQLNSAIAKRIYRFLDKKFYLRPRWKFDLHEFAYTKVGISKNTQTAQIKQRMEKAIEELEEAGFLQPATKEQRYEKIAVGKWLIHFARGSGRGGDQEEMDIDYDETSDIEQRLMKHGVSRKVAKSFSVEYPDTYLRDKIDAFEYLLIKDEAAIRNPGAWLAKSIRDDFSPPEGFKTREQKKKEKHLTEERKKEAERKKQEAEEAERRAREEQEQEARARRETIEAYLDSLPAEEAEALREESRAEARRSYPGRKKINEQSPFWQTSVSLALEKAVLRRKPDLFSVR